MNYFELFEFEIEKQKYMEYIKKNEKIINIRKYKTKNDIIKKYNYKKIDQNLYSNIINIYNCKK